MKALKRDIQYLLRNLKSLTEKTESIAAKLEQAEAAPAPKPAKRRGRPKVVKKAPRTMRGGKPTAIHQVLTTIRRSRKGIDTAGLHKKTGLPVMTIRNVVFRLKKEGKIATLGKGIYGKA